MAISVIAEFGTRDIDEIASRVGIAIKIGSWHPVTAGEFDQASMEITINERAGQNFGTIAGHELGHYFLRREEIDGVDIEKFCDDFADEISLAQKG